MITQADEAYVIKPITTDELPCRDDELTPLTPRKEWGTVHFFPHG